mmetsp:Transcript_3796/g.3539  ORF Transcript_3796/g.3539 Transcript_3796/m.3539 type:complete len:83 (-) Transcript_3796:73-321(-)
MYKIVNKFLFKYKIGRMTSVKMYILHFLIFNAVVDLYIVHKRDQFLFSESEYKRLKKHILLEQGGQIIIQEYTEKEKKHLKK